MRSSLSSAAQEHSPDPSWLVGHRVLLHEGGEPQQRALVQEVDLAGKLPIDLQGLRVEAGPVGVLEAVPTELPGER